MPPFDPNAAALPGSGLFGLPFAEPDARLVILPVPWDVTTSYRAGTAHGPAAILAASRQIDLHDLDADRPYAPGLFLRPIAPEIESLNSDARADAEPIIAAGGRSDGDQRLIEHLGRVNDAGARLNRWVAGHVTTILKTGKIAALLGGDHSVAFGAFQAIGDHFGDFGILHIDAHSDTRNAYEGFEWSHASIMHNALTRLPRMIKVVQVAIRDVCDEEMDFCRSQGDRVALFPDHALCRRTFGGESWHSICQSIVEALPPTIWISFDIDGLDPRLCPHTGTPVPGGLDFAQTNYLLREVVKAGKTILGFDLNEVAPNPSHERDDWDANVGARLLYKLCGFTLASQRLVKLL